MRSLYTFFEYKFNRGFTMLKRFRSSGFTLAEILITVVILGVVAALTLPVLMTNYKKHVTAVQLHKYYNDMSHAVAMWKKDHQTDKLVFTCGVLASSDGWCYDDAAHGKWNGSYNEGNNDLQYEAFLNWWNEFSPYLKTQGEVERFVKTNNPDDPDSDGGSEKMGMGKITFKDGSCMFARIRSTEHIEIWFATNKKACRLTHQQQHMNGRDSFMFGIFQSEFETGGGRRMLKSFPGLGKSYDNDTSIEGWKRRKDVYDSCNRPNLIAAGFRPLCSRLIEIDGWKIKSDYPWDGPK